MDKLIEKLGIDEKLTKPVKRPKSFNHVKDNIPPIEDYNFMADLLHLPEDKNGYQYLLVIVDLANDEFDIQPMKTRTAKATLDAMKTIFNRKILKKPYASIRTDSGGEFAGVFKKYLYDNSILHKVSLPNRHQQLANVESLNKQLGRLFNGYMNKKELETKKVYKNWTDIIPIVRKELNEIRKKKLLDNPFSHKFKVPDGTVDPKFKVDELVFRKLDIPQNALGHDQSTKGFRMGDYRYDKIPRKIKYILSYAGNPKYRYILDGFPNVSYGENELLPSTETAQKWEVKQIVGKKKIKNRIYYLVWFKGFKKAQAEPVLKSLLIEDGFQDEINEYEKSLKSK